MWTVLRRLFSTASWLGDAGERTAARYLRRKRYRILHRQMRNRFGEIDLIALDGDVIVFVEVKTRRSAEHGEPFEAVDLRKQERIAKAALAWLKQRKLLDRRYRFDVVSLVWAEGVHTPEITHFVDAFPAPGQGQMYS